jgi:hypothetical protein
MIRSRLTLLLSCLSWPFAKSRTRWLFAEVMMLYNPCPLSTLSFEVCLTLGQCTCVFAHTRFHLETVRLCVMCNQLGQAVEAVQGFNSVAA